MSHDDDDDNALAGIDLHRWQVPPPPAGQPPAVLLRALAPATAPKGRRVTWMVAGVLLANAAIAAVLVIILSRSPAQPTIVVPQPAGTVTDAQVRELLRQLELERQELQRRLAQIDELRAIAEQLAERLRQLEQHDKHVAPKHPDPPPPTPRQPVAAERCDEVSCVLQDYPGGCCAKYKRASPPSQAGPAEPPESLDRATITIGVASVRPAVSACGDRVHATGMVKVRVFVAASGRVTNVNVESAPDAALGACVAAALQRAVFDPTKSGGSFSYPFVF